MSLVTQLQDFATRVSTEVKAIRTLVNGNASDLSSLATTDKTNLVAAINEVAAASGTGSLVASNNLSDVADAPTARTNLDVRSTAEVTTEIGTAVSGVTLAGLGGLTQAEIDARVQLVVDTAPAALDTLNELAAALGDDANFAATMTTALGLRLAVDSVQSFTAPQLQQAQDNLSVYSRTEIGDPTTDFVAIFETGLV